MAPPASTVLATGPDLRLQHESRAAAADPVELVQMLYDELEIAVGVLIAMARQGQRVSATEPAHRARAILIGLDGGLDRDARSEEHTSELQSLMRHSYAVFCLKKKNTHVQPPIIPPTHYNS